jgi:8-oxo-dGTP diphosphatase
MNRNSKKHNGRKPSKPSGKRKRQVSREHSAGGIVFREEDGQIAVLVTQSSAHDGWIFPKGHLEHGETSSDAALREVKEETGVDARIVERVGTIRYGFRARGRQISKTALFYLMEYVGGIITDESSEVNAVLWLPQGQVAGKLSFANEAGLWAKAQGLLEQRLARSA